MNEKVQNTGETMPIFLGNVLFLFQHFFFQVLSPPPPHMGSAVFSEHLADRLALQLLCPFPHMGTLPKHQENDKKI